MSKFIPLGPEINAAYKRHIALSKERGTKPATKEIFVCTTVIQLYEKGHVTEDEWKEATATLAELGWKVASIDGNKRYCLVPIAQVEAN